jgi:hypothetical protein
VGVSARLLRSYACWLDGSEFCVCVCEWLWLLVLLARELGFLEEGINVDDEEEDVEVVVVIVVVAVCSSSLSPAIIPRDCRSSVLSWETSSSETARTRDEKSL